MSDPEPRRFFFVHVLKTAGTDLFTRLGGDPAIDAGHTYSFTEPEIYPNATDGDVFTVAPQLSIEQLLARWPDRRDEIRIVMGHFPLCTVQLLDADFTTITALREPVERTLSFLRHHRKMTPEDADRPFEDIYEDPFRFGGLIHNHMVKMFSLQVDEMTAGMLTQVSFTPEHLDRAKAGLASIDAVGLQEDFEPFCRELETRFGWRLGTAMWANRTEPVEVSEAFKARILEDNALDAELYEYARELTRERHATAGR